MKSVLFVLMLLCFRSSPGQQIIKQEASPSRFRGNVYRNSDNMPLPGTTIYVKSVGPTNDTTYHTEIVTDAYGTAEFAVSEFVAGRKYIFSVDRAGYLKLPDTLNVPLTTEGQYYRREYFLLPIGAEEQLESPPYTINYKAKEIIMLNLDGEKVKFRRVLGEDVQLLYYPQTHNLTITYKGKGEEKVLHFVNHDFTEQLRIIDPTMFSVSPARDFMTEAEKTQVLMLMADVSADPKRVPCIKITGLVRE